MVSQEQLAKMRTDPAQFFSVPAAVLAHEGLTSEQKTMILKTWKYDALEDMVADDEGMPVHESDLLDQLNMALSELASGKHQA